MKILALTSIRSDYDLMSSLYKMLQIDPEVQFKLVVSGAHLSAKYGSTINEIRRDKFEILCEIQSLLDSDKHWARLKSASILLHDVIEKVSDYNPDLIIYSGDREDVIVGGLLGVYLQIPTLHFFGGDHERDGHSDTLIRHATSKLSTVHFVATEQHAERLLKMGESAFRVFNIGSVSLDRFRNHNAFTKIELKKAFPEINQFDSYALVIFHPVDNESHLAGDQFRKIIQILEEKKINAIISYPNTDPGNFQIISEIEKYKKNNHFFFYKNLERNLFLSVFKNAEFIIGNSSAGIYEAASIPIPAINVGLRQKGRAAGENVIFCESNDEEIRSAIELATSINFLDKLKKMKNPYGDGQSCQKAYNLIKSIDFKKLRLKTEDPLNVS